MPFGWAMDQRGVFRQVLTPVWQRFDLGRPCRVPAPRQPMPPMLAAKLQQLDLVGGAGLKLWLFQVDSAHPVSMCLQIDGQMVVHEAPARSGVPCGRLHPCLLRNLVQGCIPPRRSVPLTTAGKVISRIRKSSARTIVHIAQVQLGPSLEGQLAAAFHLPESGNAGRTLKPRTRVDSVKRSASRSERGRGPTSDISPRSTFTN